MRFGLHTPKTSTAGRNARRLGLVLALAAGALLPAAEKSEPAPLAAKSLLLDIARVGEALVAVGDRGHILRSTDQGKTWTQVIAPTRAMLTGVSFPDQQHGWAVGHDGVILATGDGGLTWSRQDSGKDRETVFLDVCFRDAARGFAVGAYGKFLATADGGKTWQPAQPAADEIHYNQIAGAEGERLWIVGEGGLVLTSTDHGKAWTRVETPYEGSFFGVLTLGAGRLVVFGLRGHVYFSDDDGATWSEKNDTVRILLMGGAKLNDGRLVLAGQGGNFFISRDDGKSFAHWKPADFGTGVSAVIDAGDGALLAVGEAGAVRLSLP